MVNDPSKSRPPDEPVAIVGMACRFPGAGDVNAYWRNILDGRSSFSRIPPARWNHDLYYHPSARETDKTYARKVGLLDDVRSFAALHYGLAPLRVKVMDPQHRLLLDTVRVALQDAGYERRPFDRSKVGVFVGASVSEHKDVLTSRLRVTQAFDGAWGRPPALSPDLATAAAAAMVEDITPIRAFSIPGNLLNMAAATVAQFFDLGGPAFTMDAACSSSLVAVHEAVLHLRVGLCDAALAGGVYVNLTPDNLIGFSRVGAVSPSDACRPFDAAADGFVLGEGVGVVVLKRLGDAVRDGDRIYAVVRGVGVNNDGRSEGPMTPRQGGQEAALARAYDDCGLTPDTIGFVETHGTGTAVGDVVEVNALGTHFGARRRGPVDCVLSSVKANVGHTMSAAGVASLIKTAMVVSEATIPPQAGFTRLHPSLDLASHGFRIATRAEDWHPPVGHPRRAGISSFGFGGTNCHIVLEEAPGERAARASVAVPGAPDWPYPFVISAPTPPLLAQHLSAIRRALGEGSAARATLQELAYTLSATRVCEQARVAFIARTRDELLTELDRAVAAVGAGDTAPPAGIWWAATPRAPADLRLAFLFPGQGAQAPGLCRGLYDRFPMFRRGLDELAAELDSELPRPLLDFLYPSLPGDGSNDEEAARALMPTEICQPVMAALGLALADLLNRFGLSPAVTIGHSLGEFVAAGVGGILSPADTIRFVAARGRIIRDLAFADPGAMAAVAADRPTLEAHVAAVPGVFLANVNHPRQLVVSGSTSGVAALMGRLAAAGIEATRLPVSHAFHSPVMAPSDGPIAELIQGLHLLPPRLPVISCIDPGAYPANDEGIRRTFLRHATAPVNFQEGIRQAVEAGARVLLQLGAGSALLSMARASLRAIAGEPTAILSIAGTARDDDSDTLCRALAQLAVLGAPVDFTPLFEGVRVRPVSLPATPLETEAYWCVNREPRAAAAVPEARFDVAAADAGPRVSVGLVALFREQLAIIEAQNRILGVAGPTSAVVATSDPMARAVLAPGPEAPAPVGAVRTAPAAAMTPAPPVESARASETVSASIQDQIIGIVAGVSAFPRARITLQQRLGADLGFDSLMVVELAAKVGESFPGLGGLPKSLFVNDATVRDLVRHVQNTLGGAAGRLAAAAGSAAAGSAAAGSAAAVARYVPVRVVRPASPLPANAEPPFAGPVAIIADTLGVAARLMRLLAEAGQRVLLVDAGEIEHLLASPNGSGPVRTVVDLRGVTANTHLATPTSEDLRGPVSDALRIARAASVRGSLSGFLTCFSAAAHVGVTGFAKALAREWSESRVKAVELDVTVGADVMAEQVWSEMTCGDCDTEVSYSGSLGRCVVQLSSAPLPSIRDAASVLHKGCVVAIAGGGRGLGAKLAVELARTHGARLALLGRSAYDLATRAVLDAVHRAGGQAHYVSCDVRDAGAVARALSEARAVLGPIEAVVHTAGVLADGPVGTDDRSAVGEAGHADFAQVFDTKVGGALALWEATAADPLKVFLIYGSWAGRFGNARQTGYSAANHVVARLAERLGGERPGVRVVTLDLPPWEGSTMVATIPEPIQRAMRAEGVPFLSDETGLRLVQDELGAPVTAAAGEVIAGTDLPAGEREIVLRETLSLTTHPYLADHRLGDHAVMPLAFAIDYAAQAVQPLLGAAPRLTDFAVFEGVRIDDAEVLVTVHARGAERGGQVSRAEVEITTSTPIAPGRSIAFRCIAEPRTAQAPVLVPAGPGEAPALGVADFYARHTFHGPRLHGIVAVDEVGPGHIKGVLRSSAPGALVPAGMPFQIDPLLVDGIFQLALYWAFVRLGRAGLPLGFGELRVVGPIPPATEYVCVAALERTEGDLFLGNVDVCDRAGRVVLQLRRMSAELRELAATGADRARRESPLAGLDPATYHIESFPEFLELRARFETVQALGLSNPYFKVHQRVTNDTSVIDGREMLNFSSYNYLGLSGSEKVSRAAIEAVELYGTSVSASRVASGEKPIHRELESALADFLGCEDAIVMVGGHATNVSVIGQLIGPGDLVLHDALAHDSIIGGARLSGARRRPFPHNDFQALDRALGEVRSTARRVLIAIEGAYSMDGDIPALDRFIEIKQRHGALLLVDEAHSLGVLGRTGRGIGEHFGVDRRAVDLWMGTMSKSLASCGGYIAGSAALVEFLKYTNPGFVYSVGISPPNAASALAALTELRSNPALVTTLQHRARFFRDLCRERGIDTGMSDGTAIVPAIVGGSWESLRLAEALAARGINVQPIVYPAVEESLARLRFFITARHTEAQLRIAAGALVEELAKLRSEGSRIASAEREGRREDAWENARGDAE